MVAGSYQISKMYIVLLYEGPTVQVFPTPSLLEKNTHILGMPDTKLLFNMRHNREIFSGERSVYTESSNGRLALPLQQVFDWRFNFNQTLHMIFYFTGH